MKSVRDVLDGKGHHVFTIADTATVFDALTLLAERNIGALLVTDGDRVVGLLSERDYARKVILHGKSSRELQVREIMTSEVVTVSPERTVEDCMAIMTQFRVRHLPVFDGHRLDGLVSIGDVVKAMIVDQKQLIDQLESYIAGSY